jgi:hypothetical protein
VVIGHHLNVSEAGSINVSIGKRKIKHIRRSAVHKLAFRDVEKMGRAAMEKQDMKKSRLRAKQRKRRKSVLTRRNAADAFERLKMLIITMKPNFM